ncbi:MAG TPA: aldo/keto reductase [Candidatus Kapabacteria bacterium]
MMMANLHSEKNQNRDTVNIGDIAVHRIGLGTNRITDTENARAVLRRAWELGVNFIDTADLYQRGQSEETIGKTFSPYPSGLHIATKGGMSWDSSGAINDGAYLNKALDASLKRLKRESVDLYQLHRTDPAVPIAQTASVLKQMQASGKVRHIGLSEVTVEQIEEYRKTIEVVSVQNQYNVFMRKYDAVVDYCEANGIVFIPFYPVGKKRPHDGLEQIAAAHDASTAQIAIAWLLTRSPMLLPIPGTLSLQHLEENVRAGKIEFTAEERDALNGLSLVMQ